MGQSQRLAAVRQFFRTPKGLLIILLAILLVLASFGGSIRLVAPGLAGAVAAAALIDVLILRKKHDAWEFPSGAVLTGLFVAMVLSPFEPWYVAACASAVAIVSKYIFRYAVGERVQSGGAGACRGVLRVPHGPELVGSPA